MEFARCGQTREYSPGDEAFPRGLAEDAQEYGRKQESGDVSQNELRVADDEWCDRDSERTDRDAGQSDPLTKGPCGCQQLKDPHNQRDASAKTVIGLRVHEPVADPVGHVIERWLGFRTNSK